MVSGRRHNGEAELLRFLERPDQTADYVRRTAEWIKAERPGSAHLLPKLRQIYKNKIPDKRVG